MKRSARILAAAAALSLGVQSAAQVVTPTPKHREQIDREIREKTQRMREGKVVQANVRVTVRLLNGSRLRGVIKDGRFIERIDGKEFVATDRRGPSAGLRLWYYDDTNSYIFLPYTSIRRYKIGEKLSDSEVREISKRIDAARLAAKAKRDAARVAKQQALDKAQKAKEEVAGGPDGKPPGADGVPAKPGAETGPSKGAEEPVPSKLTGRQQALLAEFPPKEGWSLDRFRELEQRKITLGVFPNKREERFIDSFAEWNQAHELQQAEDESRDAGGSGAEVTPPPPPPPRKTS